MIVERIFERARTAPEPIALIVDGGALSYRQFAGCIGAARRALEQQQVSRQRVAALCMTHPFDSWVFGLALRSLGVVTVNIAAPGDIEALSLGPTSVITLAEEAHAWQGLAGAAAGLSAPLLTVSRALYEAAAAPAGPVQGGGGHILLTSATTGAAKKVLIDGAAEDASAAWNARIVGLGPGTSINVLYFGGWTAAGFFWPCAAWSVGACAIVDQRPDSWRSLALGARGRRRIAVVTPHMLTDLLATAGGALAREEDLTLIVVGGMLSKALWAETRERLTTDIRSIYGATEAHPATFTPLASEEDLVWHRVVEGCDLQLVDDLDRPAPAGEIGIVRIRPTRVAAYMGETEGAHAFFRHGFFHPGDLGVMRRDGRLSLQGRVTDVINVLGDKFGALPIERALQERLDAVAVCVFSAPGEAGDEMHVAVQPTRPLSAAELEAAMRAVLPAGTSGVRVHRVDGFPRNHMGKIMRGELMAQVLRAAAG